MVSDIPFTLDVIHPVNSFNLALWVNVSWLLQKYNSAVSRSHTISPSLLKKLDSILAIKNTKTKFIWPLDSAIRKRHYFLSWIVLETALSQEKRGLHGMQVVTPAEDMFSDGLDLEAEPSWGFTIKLFGARSRACCGALRWSSSVNS